MTKELSDLERFRPIFLRNGERKAVAMSIGFLFCADDDNADVGVVYVMVHFAGCCG